MGTIRCEIHINRPREAVFDYFANPDLDIARTTSGIEAVERLSPGPTAVGSAFRYVHSGGPVRESTQRFTVVRPPRELQFEGVVGALRPRNQLTFDATDGVTTVHFVGTANPTGPLRWVGPLVSLMGRRLWKERLAKAKTVLETEG